MRALLLALAACVTRPTTRVTVPTVTKIEIRRCDTLPPSRPELTGFPSPEGIFVSYADAEQINAYLWRLERWSERVASCLSWGY